MTTSGESESDDSEMGRLQGIKAIINFQFIIFLQPVNSCTDACSVLYNAGRLYLVSMSVNVLLCLL